MLCRRVVASQRSFRKALFFLTGTALVIVLVLRFITLMGGFGIVAAAFILIVQLKILATIKVVLIFRTRLVIMDGGLFALPVILIGCAFHNDVI